MSRPDWNHLTDHLAALHRAALAAAEPESAVRSALALRDGTLDLAGDRVALGPATRIFVVAAGKAAAAMARAALAILGDRLQGGVAVVPHGAESDAAWPDSLRVVMGGHPLPDQGSLTAGRAVECLLAGTREDDVVLVLLSGGASAMVELVRPGVTLDSLRDVTARLQRAGADVRQVNVVRRALSRLKGGGLARLAAPARVATLALSDVVGDLPEAIGSGPTVRSPTGPVEALATLRGHLAASQAPEIDAVLDELAAQPREPGPPPAPFHIVASNRTACLALAQAAEELGFRTEVTSLFLQGEAREAGRLLGGCAASLRAHGRPYAPPACLVFGGETTVTVRGEGHGGRNQELALGAALAMAGTARAAVFAFATDGIDGASHAAGGFVTGETVALALERGVSIPEALDRNDSQTALAAVDGLWRSGRTGTNVNDLAVVLVYP